MGGLSSILFGEKPKAKVTEKSLLTDEQNSFLRTLLPNLASDAVNAIGTAPKAPTASDLKLGALPTAGAPDISTGLANVPGSSLQNTSLAALEDRAKKIGTGEAFNEQLGLLGQLSQAFQQPTAGIPGATEALTAAFSPSAPNLNSTAQQLLPILGASPTMTPEMSTALSSVLSGQPQNFDNYFKTAIEDPAIRDFKQNVLPEISRRFTGNFYGGDRALADSKATEALLRSLTEQRATLGYQTQKDALDRVVQGLGVGQQDLARQSGDRTALGSLIAELTGQQVGSQQGAGQLALGAKELEQRGKESAAATSLDAIKSAAGIGSQGVQELTATLAAAGIPFDQSNELAKTILAQQSTAGELGLAASGQNLTAATTQNQQTLDKFGQLLNLYNSGNAADQAMVQLLLQALLTPTKENIATVTGGSSGLLSGIGQGVGSGIGAQLFK